ncbi:hypothetical protein [Arthrobacter sp. ISL-72]|uniref:hypothetical protein n=1 Tax=Arthrobacter sp. ISL-72 TaxID=2819114 RepID=UPI001BE9AAB0|nr:hypothetical protein [Arthrobacter sp. ISL-72]MBT2594673.1 hypothetical protein [Arthrobacter sp. ISL-72]
MNATVAAAVLLIVLPLAFNAAFAPLAAKFDYRTSSAAPPAKSWTASGRAAPRWCCSGGRSP